VIATDGSARWRIADSDGAGRPDPRASAAEATLGMPHRGRRVARLASVGAVMIVSLRVLVCVADWLFGRSRKARAKFCGRLVVALSWR
jgi:hypothetical protein